MVMKRLLGLIVALCAGWNVVQAQVVYDKYFSRCELVCTEDGMPLRVDTGCIGVCVRDMDGDGIADLLIGEFGNVLCPGQEKVAKPYVQGRCRVYKNYGTNERPVYRDFKWIEMNGQPLYVPITCCVPMTPAFADMDGDGVPELFSGCYDGEIYTWHAGEAGEYVGQKMILLPNGEPLTIGNAATVFPGDADGDGKIDLLLTSLYEGIFVAMNTGTNEAYRFEKAEPVLVGAEREKVDANHAVWYDWDGDGVLDIVFGANYGGNIGWLRNLGNGTYAEPEWLIVRPDEVQPGVNEGQGHGDKPKLCFHDCDGDGKDDLVVAAEVWESNGGEITPEVFEKVVTDERVVGQRKVVAKIEEQMKKYTDQLPENIEAEVDSRIPKRLYQKWVAAEKECNKQMEIVLSELSGVSKCVGYVWIYYRK